MNKYLLGIILTILIIVVGVWYMRTHRRPVTSGEVTPRPQTGSSETVPY